MKKPFVFRPDPATLQYFKNASAEAKPAEEANRFVRDFVPPKKLETWEKLIGRE